MANLGHMNQTHGDQAPHVDLNYVAPGQYDNPPSDVPVDPATLKAMVESTVMQASGSPPTGLEKGWIMPGDMRGGDPLLKTVIMAQRSGPRGLEDWLDVMMYNGHITELPATMERLIGNTFRKKKMGLHPDRCSPQLGAIVGCI